MKNEENIQNYSKKSNSKLNKILQIVAFVILIIILIVTFCALITKTVQKSNSSSNRSNSNQLTKNKASEGDTAIFSVMGKIRTFTKDENPIPIVVSVYFTYPREDTQFFEELASKQLKFQSIVASYFKNFTKDELQNKGENKIQNELLNQFNELLVLNKIKKLYFSDYIFFE